MVKSIIEAFKELPDPRREHPQTLHKLEDIIVIALCAVLGKCETWEEIADYGVFKQDVLKKYLELPNGIPSHDTINRVFSLISPVAWQSCFMTWMSTMSHLSKEKLIGIDGKVLRGSKSTGTGKVATEQAALSIVSAWASENQLVLAQIALENNGHELTVIPDLLELLDLAGASVSIDAAGCHKEVAEQIIEQGGDYLLSLKGNQGKLYDAAKWLFDYNLSEAIPMDCTQTFDVAHGREETRTCWLIKDFDYLEQAQCNLHKWIHLNAIIVVQSEVLRLGKLTTQKRFFLTSHNFSAEQALIRVRKHWSIENQQHYPLDVLFNEDASRTRTGFASQNLALLRRIALNLLNLDIESNLSKRRKMLKAAHDDEYLLQLLGLEPAF